MSIHERYDSTSYKYFIQELDNSIKECCSNKELTEIFQLVIEKMSDKEDTESYFKTGRDFISAKQILPNEEHSAIIMGVAAATFLNENNKSTHDHLSLLKQMPSNCFDKESKKDASMVSLLDTEDYESYFFSDPSSDPSSDSVISSELQLLNLECVVDGSFVNFLSQSSKLIASSELYSPKEESEEIAVSGLIAKAENVSCIRSSFLETSDESIFDNIALRPVISLKRSKSAGDVQIIYDPIFDSKSSPCFEVPTSILLSKYSQGANGYIFSNEFFIKEAAGIDRDEGSTTDESSIFLSAGKTSLSSILGSSSLSSLGELFTNSPLTPFSTEDRGDCFSSDLTKITRTIPSLLESLDEPVFNTPVIRPPNSLKRSQSVGSIPTLHDTMFNSIPGECFEIAAAISLLKHPKGLGNSILSVHARNVFSIINDYIGDSRRIIGGVGESIELGRYISQKVFKELHPNSDQIGRCMFKDLGPGWYLNNCKVAVDWLRSQIESPVSSDGNYKPLLTKIRMISAFGTILREMLAKEDNLLILQEMTKTDALKLKERSNEIATKIRHQDFDNVDTRARVEKRPFISGKALPLSVGTENASNYGLGFGKVYVPESISDLEMKIEFQKELEINGRQGIARLGQSISDSTRTGIISDFTMENVPPHFNALRWKELIDDNSFDHGSGVNRWQLQGSYAKEEWDSDLPAAGAHSGGIVDIFLSINALGDHSIFGKKEAYPIVMLLSAFMNFGGYHSMGETLPIGFAIAEDKKFNVTVNFKKAVDLYENLVEKSREYFPEASQDIQTWFQAYKASMGN